MALTDIACRAARCAPGRSRERFTDGNGMYLEVVPSGGKYWRLKYRFGGKEKCLALGTYPAVTLAHARRERDKARNQLAEGTDPGAVRQAAKLAKQATARDTFES